MVFTYNGNGGEQTLKSKKSEARKKAAERRKENSLKLQQENKEYNYVFLMEHMKVSNPGLFQTLKMAA